MNVTDPSPGLNFGPVNLSLAAKHRSGTFLYPGMYPGFILMTDEERLADPVAVVASLPRGSAVILRHYADPGREELAIRLVAASKRRGVRVLVAADARLAAEIGADGLHLPEAMAARGPSVWRKWRKPGWLVTAAAHSPAALHRAKAAGADAALLSPVFPTESHPDGAALGVLRFAAWCRKSPLPVYALGGVSAANVRRLKGCGARGVAGISGFVNGG